MPSTVHEGSHGHEVEQLQQLLNSFGYDAGTPDGIFGPHTTQAVMAFQTDYQLGADGIVGPHTWSTLQGDGGTAAHDGHQAAGHADHHAAGHAEHHDAAHAEHHDAAAAPQSHAPVITLEPHFHGDNASIVVSNHGTTPIHAGELTLYFFIDNVGHGEAGIPAEIAPQASYEYTGIVLTNLPPAPDPLNPQHSFAVIGVTASGTEVHATRTFAG